MEGALDKPKVPLISWSHSDLVVSLLKIKLAKVVAPCKESNKSSIRETIFNNDFVGCRLSTHLCQLPSFFGVFEDGVAHGVLLGGKYL